MNTLVFRNDTTMINESDIQFSKDWISAIYNLKKSLDNWAMINLQDLWEGKFQPSYMQFLLTIDKKGMTNRDLAGKNFISKQAMSKIVAKLSDLELIELKPFEKDKRVSLIVLTTKGEALISESLKRFTEMISNYKNELGNTSDVYVTKNSLELAMKFIQNYT